RWSYQDWLKYDFRAGWGTDEFEDLAADADKGFDSLDKATKAGDAAGIKAAVADLGKIAQDSKSPAAKPAYAKLDQAAQSGAGPALAAAAQEFRLAAGLAFPQEWSDGDDRTDARKVVTKNLDLLEQKRKL